MLRSQLPTRALLTSTTVATTTLALHDPPQDRDKLSIYPTQAPEILLLDTPSPLEEKIGEARRAVTKTYSGAHARVQGVVSKWIAIEHAIENRVKSIISPTESLTPGLLYVGISTLSGSIIARSRNLPTRLLLPPTFFLVSLNHFLPKTTANLSSYLSSLEERHLPSVAHKHAVANAHARMTWERAKATSERGRSGLRLGIENAVEKMQGLTGLKLKETLGWNQAVVKPVEGKASEVVAVVEKNADEAHGVVDKKVDGVKDTVDEKVKEVNRLV